MRFWFLIGFSLLVCPLRAFDSAPVKISDLSRKADLVVRGRVQEKSVQRDSDGRIYTEIKIAISEAWKGSPKSALLKIVSAGGTLGEVRDISAGEASYEVNEDIIAFLVRNNHGEAVTLKKFRADEKVAELKNAVREATR
jgi:hypothetical protein